MVSGLPCIGTTVDGIPEAIVNDQVGFLVKPKDTVTVQEAMIRCANMRAEVRKALGERAKEYVRKFHHQDRYAERLGQIYHEELAKVRK